MDPARRAAGSVLAGGIGLRLAGPRCPPEFHRQLLAELTKARRIYNDRVDRDHQSSDGSRWSRCTCATTDESAISRELDVI